MISFSKTLTLVVLATLAACTSPDYAYRNPSTDPDDRLIGLMNVYLHEDVTQSCPNGCAEEGQPKCERCSHLYNERGRILTDPNHTRLEVERLALEFPNHAPTLFAAATFAFDAGEEERAAEFLDELLARHPIAPEAAILRSRIALLEGNLPGAQRQLDEQIKYTPDHFGLREAISATYYLDGDLLQSLEQLEVAERLGAPAWRVAYNRGLIAEAAGNPRAALEQYDLTLAERPEYPAAISRRAGLLATAGEEAF